MKQDIKTKRWSIRLFLFIMILIAGNTCTRNKPERVSIFSEKEISLIERVEENRFRTSFSSSIKTDSLLIDGQQRKVFLQHPKSTITFPEIAVNPGAKLRFGIALGPNSHDKPKDGVEISLVLTFGGEEHSLFMQHIDTESEQEGRKWHDYEISLDEYSGRVCSLIFRTDSGSGGENTDNWILWSSPVLISEGRSLTLSSPKATNVILITADTLRADYLSCYGKSDIQTPYLDKMAEAGTLFENHYAQCNSTLPSHVSILSSLYLKDHGVYDNSTSIPSSILTLPALLRLSGFQTAAFVSVAHLNPEISGLGGGFDHFSLSPSVNIDKLKRNQRVAGETNKDVFRWLDNNRDFRFFLWIHYFDPHTPYMPPSPYDDLYYEGNPRDPANKSMQPLIQKRLEHLAWLEEKIDRLKSGYLDEDFLDSFQTSLKFRWGVLDVMKKDPQNLQRGVKLAEKIDWASRHVDRFLEEKSLAPEFQNWLIHFAEALKVDKEQLQRSAQQWLMGITDYDFVISQYMGEISYLDAQIGELIQRLEDFDLKDNTLLVFTADHGESMGENDIFFAHRGLYSPVIHVPLILSGPGVKKSARISTQTESVDIFPTILDIIDLPALSFLRGKSLGKLVRKGRSRSSHREVSFSEHTHGYQVSARNKDFTYIETLASSELFNLLRENAPITKGDIQLFQAHDQLERNNIAQEQPNVVRTFNRLLHDWLKEKKTRLEKNTKEIDPETLEMLKALGYIR